MADRDPSSDRDTYSPRLVLLALGFVLALTLGAYFLVHVLRENSDLQDCVMQGRSNCAPVDVPPAS